MSAIAVIVFGMLNLVNAHPLNAPESIFVTEPRSSISESFVQPANALAPIVETVEGIVTEVRLEQLLKALALIVSTPSERITVVNPVQPEKAPNIFTMEPGIVTDSMLVHPLNDPRILCTPSWKVMFLSDVQPSNAPDSMLLNEAGKEMETILEQSLKA